MSGNGFSLKLNDFEFSNYNKFIVPNNNSVNLNIGIEIKSLEYFNQKAEKIKFNMILNEHWYDNHFTWSNTIDHIMVNDNLIWKPDLELYNAASSPEVYENIHIKIYRDGFIRWNRPILYSFSCPLQLKDFPFDKQKCTMTFGSWKFSTDYVNINLVKGGNILQFRLKNPRKLDRKALNLLRNQEIQAIIN